MKAAYYAGIGYIAVCGALFYRHAGQGIREKVAAFAPILHAGGRGAEMPAAPSSAGYAAGAGSASSPEAWFSRAKPFCNAVEAEVHLRKDPPPPGTAGAGYGAACYALAGKIRAARALIDALPEAERAHAAGIVFDVGHPAADAGDNASAGPLMGLVVEYRPDDYMALYHAGIAEFGNENIELARTHLEKFMALYPTEDGWRESARATIAKMPDPRGL